jgi:glyoxylase-like metal-dependent hydrolase (beta-lactamase superfamily II)
MIQIKQFVFNPFQENTYVLYDETKECVFVDAGCYSPDEQNELVRFIESNGLTPKYSIITHGHVDHVIGNGFVKQRFGVEILGNPEDLPLLQAVAIQAAMFGLVIDDVPNIDTYINHNDSIRFGSSELKVIHTPGHSLGGICLYCAADKFIIAGDTLFKASIGRTDLSGGNFEQIISSISNKLLPLGDDVVVYSGHGESSTIGWEKKNNQFLSKQ